MISELTKSIIIILSNREEKEWSSVGQVLHARVNRDTAHLHGPATPQLVVATWEERDDERP